ncbi:hypothetical protein COLO4_18268 [Corchorus olitorius]|uniref:F-box domain-containing protein n=1 Tax=Corchorus olitorius TaxID=93759 RepID=A0A1R3J9V4_9ROSI|nr:hypothetical protein COLO4_18268 [Corchorus olitorius]
MRNGDGGGAGDRISKLPQDILSHIVSFLNMKEALGTRALSKTWKSFWANQFGHLRTLDFNMDHFRTRNRGVFFDYVDEVIRLLGPRNNVEGFRVRCYELQDGDLPHFFTNLERIEDFLNYPRRIPVFLGTYLVIHTPNLVDLEIEQDRILAIYEIPEIPSLRRANLSIGPHPDFITKGEFSAEEARRVMLLLQGIRHASKLILYESATAALSHVVDEENEPLPIFSNLLNLQLCIDNCYGWKLLPHFLNRSPNLKILQLAKRQDPYEGEPEVDFDVETYGWVEPLAAPFCLWLRLEQIKMTLLKRSKDEENVIRFLLENSMVLEKMTINFADYRDGGLLDKHMIEGFPRGSANCQLIFD